MRMSVGIGPFRFYSGPRRRLSRKEQDSRTNVLLLAILGGVIYLIVKLVIATWPVIPIAVAALVFVAIVVRLVKRAFGPTAEAIELAAQVRGSAIGEAIAREHPAHVGDRSYLQARTINHVMIAAGYVADKRKLSPRERHFMCHAAYDEAKRLGFPQK